MLKVPGQSYSGVLEPLSDAEKVLRDRLKAHVSKLAGEIGERSVRCPGSLEASVRYIEADLKEDGYQVSRQELRSGGQFVSNVEAERKGSTRPDEIVVVGGHYDSVIGCPGANDNATGTAGVLEIARMLAQLKPARTVRFVAFVNEEPPFFQTDEMGSVSYARRCKERKEKIVAMLSIETIGYYTDAKGSQTYPFPFNLLYPDIGNFIGFVSDLSSRPLLINCIESFRRQTKFPSEGVAAPDLIPGIGWSDQWPFWQCGYPGIMVTDTAPYRYPYYHTPEDTPDRIDYDRTARVVAGLARVVEDLVK